MRALLLLTVVESIAGVPPSDDWTDFKTEEYGLTLGLVATITAITLMIPKPPDGWKEGLLFDQDILDGIGANGKEAQEAWSTASDVMQNTLVAAPLVLDIGATALLQRGDPQLAWDMMLIDLETLAIAAATIQLTKRTIGRVRPTTSPCEGSDDEFGCRSVGSRRGFISGHATAAFAAAGLMCIHHEQLKLWGEAADTAACATSLGVASATSVLRVVSRRHYPTDIMAGAAIGLFAGYVIPYLLHFAGSSSGPPAGDTDTGAIGLLVSGGSFVVGGTPFVLGGFDGVMSHRVWFAEDFALLIASDGRVLQSTDGTSYRNVAPSIGLYYGGASAGFVTDYRSVLRNDVAENELTGGIEMRFRVREPEQSGLELTLRWLPLFDGRSGYFVARTDVTLFENIALRADLSRVGEDAAIVFGVGGKIPW